MKKTAIFVTLVLLAAGVACTKADKPDIVGEDVTYSTNGVTLKGYIAYDAAKKGPRPGVLVVHEWWGHNDYARERARMLAELGYTALAVDMYGDGKTADHPDNAGAFMTEALGNMELFQKKFEAGHALLKNHENTDPAHIAAIGYCFGGKTVLEMARAGLDLDGVASFHGILATGNPAQKGTIKASVIAFQGGDDPFNKPEDVAAIQAEMAAAEVDFKYVEYPGVRHSFTNPGATAVGEKFGLPLVYNEAADKDSWGELKVFLARVFAE